jgi:transcriptional regulator with XRE-family HTH domain
MNLASRLRDAMEKRGFRQAKLAELAGVPEETLSRILTGVTTDPRVFTLKKVANPLDVTVGWLLSEKGYEISGDDRSELRRTVTLLERLLRETQPVRTGAMEPNVSPVILARKPPLHAPRRTKVRPVSATDWRESFGDRTEDSDVEIRHVMQNTAQTRFRAEGESMEGEFIADGDLLFVRQNPTRAPLAENRRRGSGRLTPRQASGLRRNR